MRTLQSNIPPAKRQRGVSLIFALITLVSLLLASIALVRSVSSGSQVLGNIAFQQDTIAAADLATAQATAYISAATSDLTTSSSVANSGTASARSGFYANAQDTLDVTGQQLTSATRQLVDWDLDGCGYATAGTYATCNIIPHDVDMSGASSSSTTARYVILRLCAGDGAMTSTTCAKASATNSTEGGSNRGECSGENNNCVNIGSTTVAYYRIVVRVLGARGTTSFTETIVQF